MGAKVFTGFQDFLRHGMHMQLFCSNGPCRHTGIVEAYPAYRYFKLHRWGTDFHAGALYRFRCTRCGAPAGSVKPTDAAPTVTNFFPANERGWKMLQRRLRG